MKKGKYFNDHTIDYLGNFIGNELLPEDKERLISDGFLKIEDTIKKSFLDSEVSVVGEYQSVQFFIDKVDVRPYERLYTKFGRNKFRLFEKRTEK